MDDGWHSVTAEWFLGDRYPEKHPLGLWLDPVYRAVWLEGGPKYPMADARVLVIDGTAVEVAKTEAGPAFEPKGLAKALSGPSIEPAARRKA